MTRVSRGALAGLFLAALFEAAVASGGPSAFGPAPRGPDGRFLNTEGEIEHAGPLVTLPFFLRRVAGSFRDRPGAPESIVPDSAFLRANAVRSAATVTWIGHATLLVQLDGVTFLTDPIWSDTASPLPVGPRRFVPPAMGISELPPIHFVLISHNHYDHLDLPTLRILQARAQGTRFLVPLGNGELLRGEGIENVIELDWGERVRLGRVSVHCLPAQHWSRRSPRDMRRALWSSWAVVGPGRRFYFGGDSGYFSGFERIGSHLGPFDLAALPIGAYEPQAMMRPFHLDPEQAVQAALDLGARRVLAVHFGTFDLSDEPLDEPPRRFRAAAKRAASAGLEEAWVLRIGEMRRF